MMVGEVYSLDTALAARYYGQNDELNLVFNLSLVNLPWDARLMRKYVDGFDAGVPPGSFPTVVLGSHDEPRLASRVGERQARTAAMMLLTLRGAPFIYYGDELGMTDVPIPPDRMRDPWPMMAGLPHLSRDPARTPMQWDASPGAGFRPAAGVAEPWLPLHPDYRERNVEMQRADPRSMLSLYRRLLQLRRSSPALHSGTYRPAAITPEGSYVYYRTLDDQEFLVALNFTGSEVQLQLEGGRSGQLVLSTELDHEEEVQLGGLGLRPHEGIVVSLGSSPAPST
jgi:alpha-glucosidase